MAVQATGGRIPARGPRVWWRGLPRALRIALVAGTVLLFLLVSALLARYLSAENLEREDAVALVRAEARGDVAAMLASLSGCRASASCVAQVRAVASDPRVRRAGAVKLLQFESKTAGALFGASGRTRVAWTVLGGLPVVQCVEVRRTGNPLTGIGVQLLGLSEPISSEGKCSKPSEIERDEEQIAADGGGR